MGGRPQLQWNGRPIPGVVPALQMFPQEDLFVNVEVCLIIGPNIARWFQYRCVEPAQLLIDYLNDPEEVLQKYFSWSYDPTVKAPSVRDAGKEVLTLKDLGL